MKILSKLTRTLSIVLFLLVSIFAPISSLNPVHLMAQEDVSLVCQVFPFLDNIGAFGIAESLCGTGINRESTLDSVGSTIRFVLSLIFVAIIVISIYVIIRAAIKYIRSEGKAEEVEAATKAIKNVFIGIGALFVGIIGIIIILAFFDAGGALNDPQEESDNPLDTIFEGVTD